MYLCSGHGTPFNLKPVPHRHAQDYPRRYKTRPSWPVVKQSQTIWFLPKPTMTAGHTSQTVTDRVRSDLAVTVE